MLTTIAAVHKIIARPEACVLKTRRSWQEGVNTWSFAVAVFTKKISGSASVFCVTLATCSSVLLRTRSVFRSPSASPITSILTFILIMPNLTKSTILDCKSFKLLVYIFLLTIIYFLDRLPQTVEYIQQGWVVTCQNSAITVSIPPS